MLETLHREERRDLKAKRDNPTDLASDSSRTSVDSDISRAPIVGLLWRTSSSEASDASRRGAKKLCEVGVVGVGLPDTWWCVVCGMV